MNTTAGDTFCTTSVTAVLRCARSANIATASRAWVMGALSGVAVEFGVEIRARIFHLRFFFEAARELLRALVEILRHDDLQVHVKISGAAVLARHAFARDAQLLSALRAGGDLQLLGSLERRHV